MKKFLSLLLTALMLLAVMPAVHAEEPVTIRFSWWGDAVRHEATLKAIELFEQAYPNIHVEAEYGGWDGYTDKLTTQIMGGTAADVVQDGGHFQTYIIYGAQYTDLNDYLDIIDTSHFSQSLLESYCTVNGQLISMPTGVQAWTTLQNTSLLEDNGVEIPQRWTWDTLVEASKKLHEADPEAYMLNVSMETITNWLFPMYIQQKVGGTVINNDYEMEFTAEDLTAYLTWLEDMWAANGLQGRSEQLLYDGSPLENPKWNGGKLAISMCSSASYSWYVYDEYLKEHIDVVDCFSFPEGEGDNDTIVVPLDNSDDTRQKVNMAATFAKTFGSTIHLLGLYTSTAKDVRAIVNKYISMVQRHFEKTGVQYQTKFIEVGKNVSLDTIDYANSVNADMIAIMTEQESSLSNLIMGTYAQQMLTNSKIPVLTVRPRRVLADTVTY